MMVVVAVIGCREVDVAGSRLDRTRLGVLRPRRAGATPPSRGIEKSIPWEEAMGTQQQCEHVAKLENNGGAAVVFLL